MRARTGLPSLPQALSFWVGLDPFHAAVPLQLMGNQPQKRGKGSSPLTRQFSNPGLVGR